VKPLLVTSGEPAGIGPDVCLALASLELPLVILCDKELLGARAKQLGLDIVLVDYEQGKPPTSLPQQLTVLSLPCKAPVIAGTLNPENASYVMQMLTMAVTRCRHGEFSALITAPVHKAIINQAGYNFTGHTEFFADYCGVPHVVMMLACSAMRVALITTHLPLKKVPYAITQSLIIKIITLLNQALQQDFGIHFPKIYVAGLNPHAGEAGYLGCEEIKVITPALAALQQQGINVQGPFPADTMFTPDNAKTCDAFVAMYHDQGLAVLKYAGFGHAVNVTLGLPIVRTSVDHGTALELAGTGLASASSLFAAVEMAAAMVHNREHANDNH
jgi:4-hydroxythreonine-4-phosphate dehydrogenase